MLLVGIRVNTLDGLIQNIPRTLSLALNDSLSDARDRLITESWPAAVEAKAQRGGTRRSTTVRKREAGRSVFKLEPSDEANLTGKIAIDVGGGDADKKQIAKGSWRLLTAHQWVEAFVNSTSPVFWGKSKQERIRMALGAYYRIKRGGELREAIADRGSSDIFAAFLMRDFNQFVQQAALRHFPSRTRQLIRESKKDAVYIGSG